MEQKVGYPLRAPDWDDQANDLEFQTELQIHHWKLEYTIVG